MIGTRLLPGLLVLSLSAPAWADPLVLDRVVAVFSSAGEKGKRTVLTLSDLEVEARLAFLARGGTEAAAQRLPQEALDGFLDWLIAELLLLEEAEQLHLDTLDPPEVEAAVQALRDRFETEESYTAFLRRHEITEGEVIRVVRRRLVVGRYLDSRIRLAGRITEAEVEAAWNGRKGELGGMALKEARLPLRAQLEKEQRERIVSVLVAELRSRAGVRILQGVGDERGGP